jgi:hypothetical protein
VGWDWVHLVRQLLFGLLYQSQMVEDECEVALGMRIGRGNRSTRGKPATNRLSYDTASRRTNAIEQSALWWAELVKNFLTIHTTRWFGIVIKRTRHWSLSWAKLIHPDSLPSFFSYPPVNVSFQAVSCLQVLSSPSSFICRHICSVERWSFVA